MVSKIMASLSFMLVPEFKEKIRNAFIYMYQFHNNYSCRIPMYCRSNNLHSNQTYDVCPLTTFVTIEILNQWPTPPPPPKKKNLSSILSSQVIEFFSPKKIFINIFLSATFQLLRLSFRKNRQFFLHFKCVLQQYCCLRHFKSSNIRTAISFD